MMGKLRNPLRLTFEDLLCGLAGGIPWMPFLNLGNSPINFAYLLTLGMWGLLAWRLKTTLSIKLTPGLVMGLLVFSWCLIGCIITQSLSTGKVDLLHFANFLLFYALIQTSIRNLDLVYRLLKSAIFSSWVVAGFGIFLSILVNIFGLTSIPRFMVDQIGSILYGSRGQENLLSYGEDMGNWYRDGIFRTVSIFYNPMQNSEYTMFFLFMSLGQLLTESPLFRRRTLIIGTTLLTVALFVIFSRTAYFGAIVGGGGFFLLVLLLGFVPRKRVIRLGLLIGIILLLASPFIGDYALKTIQSIGDPRNFSNAGRLIAMTAGVLVWIHKPFLGTGFGNEYAMAYGNIDLGYMNFIEKAIYPYIQQVIIHAKAVVFKELFEQTNYHSGHLSLLVQLGIIGVTLFWGWQAVWVQRAWKLARKCSDPKLKGLGLGFVGAWGTFWITQLIDGNMFYPKYILNVYLIAALCEIAFHLTIANPRKGANNVGTP